MCPVATRVLRTRRSVNLSCTWRGALAGARYAVQLRTSAGLRGPLSLRRTKFVSIPALDDDDPTGEAPEPTTTTTTTTGPSFVSIWTNDDAPAVEADGDSSAVELGVKFRSKAATRATGVRFYKGPGNAGTHVGNLWTADGSLLASVTFTGESATGWQSASFGSPVTIAANTTYVVSYFAPNGHYAVDSGYFADDSYSGGLLTALPGSVAGGNGVYAYGAQSQFPSSTYGAANYWVDVVVEGVPGLDATPPTVSSVSPSDGATGTSTNAVIHAVFSEAVDPATITASTVTLRRTGVSATVDASIAYDAATRSVTITPVDGLQSGATYVATLTTGIADPAHNGIARSYSWSFSTALSGPVDPAGCPAAKRIVTTSDVTRLVNSGYPAGTAVFVPDAPDPWGGCFPGPLTTGVPAGTSLTPYTGPCIVSIDNTIISNKLITGCGRFVIEAANVTITSSRFVGTHTIDVSGSLTITDSEGDFGAYRDGQGMTGSNITASRLDFSGGHRQMWCSDCVVQDSYFHDQNISEDAEAHASAMRTESHTTYRHNSFGCDLEGTPEGGGCSAAQTGYPDFGPIHHNTVERNLVWANSTGYCAYGGWNPGKPYNDDPLNATYITFRDNVMRRGVAANDAQDWEAPLTSRNRYSCGTWGPTTSYRPDREGSVFTGNMWDDGLLWDDDTESIYPFHE